MNFITVHKGSFLLATELAIAAYVLWIGVLLQRRRQGKQTKYSAATMGLAFGLVIVATFMFAIFASKT